MYWNGTGGWGMGLMMVSTLLFWGLIVAGVVFAIRGVNRGGSGDQVRPFDAEQILAQRYARGEINEEEYQQRLQTLRQSGHAATRA
jgi:putative membrane protein